MRILSKKMKPKSKKGVSWAQGGRNRKLTGKAISDKLEIEAAIEKKQNCSNCKKLDYLESCDECQKEFGLECLGLYHGSEKLFCQACFNQKSKAEKEIMLGKVKTTNLRGFNSVQSCPQCNSPCVTQSSELSRHGFTNHSEFTDQALLEELIIRIKKGCLEIKKVSKDFVLVTECRWDLRDELTNYQVSLQELRDIQNQFRKREDQNKLCSICLEHEKDDTIFCKFCWDREVKLKKLRSSSRKKS